MQPSVLLKVECCSIRRETKARSLKSVKAIGQTSHPFGRSVALLDGRESLWKSAWHHGGQMAIAEFLDRMCLALRASGLWLR